MALSLSNFLVTLLMLLPHGLLASVVAGPQTHTYDWNVEWLRRNPDGLAERAVIGINGQWPLPLINITKGDRVVVNLHNQVCMLFWPLSRSLLIVSSLGTRVRACTGMVSIRTVRTRWMDRLESRNATFPQDNR